MLSLGVTDPIAVVVSALAGFLLGAVWYSRVLFGEPWTKALGKSREDLSGPVLPMAVSLIGALITALALSLTIRAFGVDTALGGTAVGLLVGVCFVATNMISNSLFAGSPLGLYLIDAGYRVVFTGVMGTILGAWR
jgi:hypothetical protein